MATDKSEYLLAQASNEVERLRLWAQVWETETETMLDQMAIQPGWRCVDLGCGPQGVLGPLARRVGASGAVVGLDVDPTLLDAAREYVHAGRLVNVDLVQGDAYETGLPRGSFDLVHARFMLTPLGRDEALLREMFALLRPGGTVALQESDSSGYLSYPRQPVWERLKELTIAAFARGGGDYDTGRRLYGILRRAGLDSIHVRAPVLALPGGHPYRRWPLQSAAALRSRMLAWGLTTETELDHLLAAGEDIVNDEDVFLMSFMVVQAWGHRPAP